MNLSVCLPLRWLSAMPELAEHNWGPVIMGLALYVVIDKLKEVIAHPRLILQESFMMHIRIIYSKRTRLELFVDTPVRRLCTC